MAFLQANGARIHYRIEGERDNPVVVLSNSLGANLSMWDAQVPEFLPHFRLLRYDTRGHGQSEVTPGPYTIELLAADVLALLDALGLEAVHFCGLSMGGMIAMQLGVHAMNRVTRLVLCNTAPRIGTTEGWNERISMARERGMREVAEGTVRRWFTEGFAARNRAVVSTIREAVAQCSPEGYAANCAAVRDFDGRQEICRVQAPTLVVAGSFDAGVPQADTRFLTAQIPGARYAELPTAHLSNVEAAREFNSVALQFLRSAQA